MLYYLKGQYIDQDDAMLHVSERAVRFGDGVFETIRVAESTPLFIEMHLERLQSGLNALRIPSPKVDIQQICDELIARNQLTDGTLRLSVSRGIGSKGYLPTGNATPTVIIETLLPTERSSHPLTAWVSMLTKPSPSALPVQAKLSQGVNSTLARMEAVDNGCDEALMLNIHDIVCEFSSANIFWLKNDTLYTPSLNCGVLAGITRERLLSLWGTPVIEAQAELPDLLSADAIIATNATNGAQAVKHLLPHDKSFESTELSLKVNSLFNEQQAEYIAAYHASR